MRIKIVNRYFKFTYGGFEISICNVNLREARKALDECLAIIPRQVCFTKVPRAKDFDVEEITT
jgi:hypothetical protein